MRLGVFVCVSVCCSNLLLGGLEVGAGPVALFSGTFELTEYGEMSGFCFWAFLELIFCSQCVVDWLGAH